MYDYSRNDLYFQYSISIFFFQSYFLYDNNDHLFEQLYGINYYNLAWIICTLIKQLFMFNNKYLFVHRYFQLINQLINNNNCEKKDKCLDLARELKKLWNMQVTKIPIVIGTFGTVTKGLLKELEDIAVGRQVETIQTTA